MLKISGTLNSRPAADAGKFVCGPFPLIDSTNVVASKVKQNNVGFQRVRIAAKTLTSGQEVAEQPVRGRGTRKAPNINDDIQFQYGAFQSEGR